MPANKRDEKQITKILERVDRKEQSLLRRFDWMDHDYENGWRLDPFTLDPEEGVRKADTYTSNFPKLLNGRVSGAIAYAEKIIRVEDSADNEELRDKNNAYERLAIGMLGNADERLQNSNMPTFVGASAWYGCVRGGWIAARAVLIKDEDGETVEDIWPIDPRSLVFEMGKGEPLWAAVVTERSKQDIRDEYPKFKFDDDGQSDPADDNDDRVRVVDYYDIERGKDTKTTDDDGEEEIVRGKKRYINRVIIDKQYAKSPTNTFAVKFPIPIRLIGNNPGVANFTIKNDNEDNKEIIGIEDVGDSVYTPLRQTMPAINRLRSYRQALTHKAVQGTLLVESKRGDKELDQDVFDDGSEINISTDNNEKISLLEVAQLTNDSSLLEQAYVIDQTNAGLSEQRFGRLVSPVSGAALRIVGQSDNEVVAPFLEAVQSLLIGVVDNLGKQYETERYKPIKVRGKTHNLRPFNEIIKPEDIKGHGILSIELKAVQPENEAERWQAALLASQIDPNTGIGLVSQQYAATQIAKVQDWDHEQVRMNAAKARMSSEKMMLLTQWEAARLAQDEEAMFFLAIDINRILDREEMEEQALLFAFRQHMDEDPMGTAGAGVRGANVSTNGAGGQQTGNPATLNIDPTLISNSGRPGVDQTASPDAGFNTTAPRGGGSPDDIGLEPNV